MSRWVRLSCDIFEHPLFERSELSDREAWIWLVTRAAWKATRHRIGREVVDVPRGSLFITLREMQVAWGWRSDARVRSFLGIMEREGMIERATHAGKTQITICNYERYQDAQRAEKVPDTQEKRAENALKIPEYQDIPSLRSDSIVLARECERELLDAGVSSETLGAWKGVRKAKRAGPITRPVIARIFREAAKAGISPGQAVTICVERGWQGFEADWVNKPQQRAGPMRPPQPLRGSAAIADALHRITTDAPDNPSVPRGVAGFLPSR